MVVHAHNLFWRIYVKLTAALKRRWNERAALKAEGDELDTWIDTGDVHIRRLLAVGNQHLTETNKNTLAGATDDLVKKTFSFLPTDLTGISVHPANK